MSDLAARFPQPRAARVTLSVFRGIVLLSGVAYCLAAWRAVFWVAGRLADGTFS